MRSSAFTAVESWATIRRIEPSALDPPPPPELPEFPPPAPPLWAHRALAVLEILICSDFPTQIIITFALVRFGVSPYAAGGGLNIAFVVTLSLVDAAVLVGLVLLFLMMHAESPREVFLGTRPVAREAAHGIPQIFVALGIGILVLAPIQKLAPWLHTVERNPLEELMRTPAHALMFAVVVIVAGGLREEVQRAFILHRFEQWLGGGVIGVVTASIAFGAGHLVQGVDAALATGALGAFWGLVYLRRRSIVAPMVSHSGFDLLQIVQAAFLK